MRQQQVKCNQVKRFADDDIEKRKITKMGKINFNVNFYFFQKKKNN